MDRNRYYQIIIIFSFILGLSFIFQPSVGNHKEPKNYELIRQIELKISYFNNSCDPISIDGDAVGMDAHNWSWAVNQTWCNLKNGTYYIENLTIDGNGDTCIEIRNSNVNLVINNCTLYNSTNADQAGIFLENVNNTIISNNNCSLNNWGFIIKGAGTGMIGFNNYNHSIINNTFIDNLGFDLYLMNSYDSLIFNNTLKNKNYLLNPYYSGGGIFISTGRDIFIDKNKIHNCPVGIRGISMNITKNQMINSGIQLEDWSLEYANSHFIDTTNTVNGLPVYYYANESRLNLTDIINPGQLIFANCNDSFISDFQFSYTDGGIQLYYCFNNSISNISSSNGIGGIIARKSGNNSYTSNTFNNNYFFGMCLFNCNNSIISDTNANNNGLYGGIYIWNTNNSKIIGNTLNNNSRGIFSGFCSNDIISGNIISNNEAGIECYVNCEENLIYNNTFFANTVHANGTTSLNYWNNSIIGNYWDDYLGVDADFNGIGDIIHNISQSPLVQDFIPIWDSTIDIISPIQGANFTSSIAPTFSVVFYDLHVNYTWYSINGGKNITFTTNGQFDPVIWEGIWNSLNYSDTITIKFYFNNTLGYEAYKEVSGIKGYPSNEPNGTDESNIPGFDLLIFSSCMIAIVSLAIWIRKKRLKF